MDTVTIYDRALSEFGRRVHAIGSDQWGDPTPCSEWSVRDLVNHLVSENLWAVPLLQGKKIEEVGDALSGDLLGDDPVRAWDDSAAQALAIARRLDFLDRTVHLSYGDTTAQSYLQEMASDHVIHSWDLARGIGADEAIAGDLLDFAYDFLMPAADEWRSAGVFGERVEIPEGADKQTQLLAATGRRV
jgi:uncharacterized protein (TIGR03086 family)